jgi:hypothetical protein
MPLNANISKIGDKIGDTPTLFSLRLSARETINTFANAKIFGGFNLYFPLLSRCVFDSVCQIFANFPEDAISIMFFA